MPTTPIIVWFRQDLRLTDHPALHAAVGSGRPVVPIYVLDDENAGAWQAGGASRWWLHGSLTSLAGALQARGSRLLLRKGNAVALVVELARSLRADAVHCTRCYEPWAVGVEQALKDQLTSSGIQFKRFRGSLLHEPEEILTRQGEPYRVYSPFARAAMQATDLGLPLPAPDALMPPEKWPRSERLSDWRLLPARPDWAAGLRAAWQPGEDGARARLDDFLDQGLKHYRSNRDRPDLAGTSRLSPHLHFGEISPRTCWLAAIAAAADEPSMDAGLQTLLREFLWREFSYHLLHYWPDLPEQPFRPEFARFPWQEDRSLLRQWQQGRTGYPIVDAGMRELWTTGWMHNRVRMITASFLIKHLMQPWQHGEAWFWDTLVDADLASNSASWQWVAGSGADAAPYFRIFNPVKQGTAFDPDGIYVRRWCPELSRLPTSVIHAPWLASEAVLSAAGVHLGETYPLPIVDHGEARARALAAFSTLKRREEPSR